MIGPQDFIAALDAAGIGFVTGVPDSLLKDVCAAITTHFPPERHVIAANEGAAVGMAIGHYLATRRPALVYMQNSGLGNAVNPLASLADPAVYGIPMVLMVGWRGELQDGVQLKDEPQHVTQGRITPAQLEVLGIPYRIVDAATGIEACLREQAQLALAQSRPVALLVRKGTFGKFTLPDDGGDAALPSREDALAAVVARLPADLPIVSTTGMLSRELFELRKAAASGHGRDFLTVGGMGHAVSIASGIALALPGRRVACLDGDGAMLMHLGALTESARRAGLLHIVFNNGAHDSVGGQPTLARTLDLAAIAARCGYGLVLRADGAEAIAPAVDALLAHGAAGMLEIRCRRGARADLSRPDRSPAENKADFMDFLAGGAA
jgi:phosphonopyruvate decarboxylase